MSPNDAMIKPDTINGCRETGTSKDPLLTISRHQPYLNIGEAITLTPAWSETSFPARLCILHRRMIIIPSLFSEHNNKEAGNEVYRN